MASSADNPEHGGIPRRPDSTLSKKRYIDIQNSVGDLFVKEGIDSSDELRDSVMKIIRDIMNFDMNATRYNKEQGKKTAEYGRERRRKKKISDAIELLKTVDEKDI